MARKEFRRYSREFKLEAVRLAEIGERPKAQIARELGIRVNQLRKWRLEFKQEERTGSPKPTAAMDGDLDRLRRENARLKEENELLNKAAIDYPALIPATGRYGTSSCTQLNDPPTGQRRTFALLPSPLLTAVSGSFMGDTQLRIDATIPHARTIDQFLVLWGSPYRKG